MTIIVFYAFSCASKHLFHASSEPTQGSNDARPTTPVAALLIVDEIGCLSLAKIAPICSFQLVGARFEIDAMILTSNRSFTEWAEVFGDPVVATALLERLLYHAIVVQTEGTRYRLITLSDLIQSSASFSATAAQLKTRQTTRNKRRSDL